MYIYLHLCVSTNKEAQSKYVLPLKVTDSLMDVRDRLRIRRSSGDLVEVIGAMATSNADGSQEGLAAALLLGDVLRCGGEDLELLPEEADRRSQPLGVAGEGEGDCGTGRCSRRTSGSSRRVRSFRRAWRRCNANRCWRHGRSGRRSRFIGRNGGGG